MSVFADMADAVMNGFDDAVEPVYYKPVSGTEITFNTHVFREQPREYDNIKNYGKSAVSASMDYDIMVYIPRSIVAEIKLHQDTMRVRPNLAKDYQQFLVTRIQEQDVGAYIVRIS